ADRTGPSSWRSRQASDDRYPLALLARRIGGLLRGIGETAEDLEIGDKRIHLGQAPRIAIEGANIGGLAITLGDAAGVSAVGIGLAVGVRRRVGDHLLGVGNADGALRD